MTQNAQSPIDLTFNYELPNIKIKYEIIDDTSVFTDYKNKNIILYGINNFIEHPSIGSLLLKSIHCHFPSEHTINGRASVGEMHFLHESVDTSINKRIVLSVLFGIKDKPNERYKDFIRCIKYQYQLRDINFATLLPTDRSSYWTYEGSLTSNPYTENVKWIIYDNPVYLSLSQADFFKLNFSHDARIIQPLNNRTIVHKTKSEVTYYKK